MPIQRMESNIKLGKLFGIDIGINYSWFIIFFLISYLVLEDVGTQHSGWPLSWRLTVAVSSSLLFFLSILAHEMSHSLLALAKGLPVHSITLFVFGGVSRIEKEAMNAATEFWVGIVGPISSGMIAALFYALSLLVEAESPIAVMALFLASANLMLAIFNLIPGYPLDGGRVLRAFLWAVTGSAQKATRIAATIGKWFAFVLILGGLWIALQRNFAGLWLAVIGWFLLEAARSALQSVAFDQALRGARARDLMTTDVPTVPAHLSLSELFDEHLFRTGRRCFIVMSDGRMAGLITGHELKAIPRNQWIAVSVEQAMRPFESMRWVEPGAELVRVLEVMDRDDVNQVPVVSEGKLEGLVRREDVLRFISTRNEFNS